MFKFMSRDREGTIANVRVGKAQGRQSASAHQTGVRRGNATGNFEREAGIHATEDGARASARRSTGVNPEGHEPIDPRMPHLTPA